MAKIAGSNADSPGSGSKVRMGPITGGVVAPRRKVPAPVLREFRVRPRTTTRKATRDNSREPLPRYHFNPAVKLNSSQITDRRGEQGAGASILNAARNIGARVDNLIYRSPAGRVAEAAQQMLGRRRSRKITGH